MPASFESLNECRLTVADLFESVDREVLPTQLAGPLRVVDMFAGAGGLSQGFAQAGCEIVAATDNDPDAAATFQANFPKAQFICGDIRDLAIQKAFLASAQGAEIVVGGPPCQAFSQVRNHSRLIDDSRNSLYREFVRVVSRLKPMAFLMENVTGMDQMGFREQIIEDLRLSGRYMVEAQVVDAADFGVPQSRKRLLFIGVLSRLRRKPPKLVGSGATAAISLTRQKAALPSEQSMYDVSLSDGYALPLLNVLRDPRRLAVVTVGQAISDFAFLQPGERLDSRPVSELPPPASAYQRRMRIGLRGVVHNVQVPRMMTDTALRLAGIPAGGNHRDLEDGLLDRYLSDQRWGQANGTGRLSRKHFYAYRRLHPGIWAWTLNTKADAAYHYSSIRSLSVREFARLQSFPDRFIFTTDVRKGSLPGRHDGGAAHSKYRQVGNAVPPLLAQAAAESLCRVLIGDGAQ